MCYNCNSLLSTGFYNNNNMLEYLSMWLTTIEGHYTDCEIVIAGDFNHLNINYLCREFPLKQLVHLPTRGASTLDLVLTNLQDYYKSNPAEIHPPFGLSDHNTIVIHPNKRILNARCSWTEATDGNGGAVRVLLFDYRKAFNLIDHRVLARKIVHINIPLYVKYWVINFLMNREQRVKLSRDCYSEWGLDCF